METNSIPQKKYVTYVKKREMSKKQQGEINQIEKQPNNTNKEENKCKWLFKVTTDDLSKLCDHLSVFNTRVQTIKGLIELRYDLPNKLQEKLEVEAEELGSLYRELQDAIKNLELIRSQRVALVKEKLCVETQLDKLKADTITELEVIVSVYDNMMMDRWLVVKNGNSILNAENFLVDVKGKLQAMKNLQILGTQKLSDLKKKEIKKEHNDFNKEKNNNKDFNSNRIRVCLSECSTNVSQTSFLESMDEGSMQSSLYNLVSEHILALPSWNQDIVDVD